MPRQEVEKCSMMETIVLKYLADVRFRYSKLSALRKLASVSQY